jgi:hypothetical protein
MTKHPEQLTDRELKDVTTVFRSFETGLRTATIHSKDLHTAMKRLGLNPTTQEAAVISNQISQEGLIYFPNFCKLVLGHFQNDSVEDELFRQNMFKVTRLIDLFENNCSPDDVWDRPLPDPYPTEEIQTGQARPFKKGLRRHHEESARSRE